MSQINAYINFDNNCREAMNFYKDCLGGDLNLQTIEGSPAEKQCPAAMKDQILHAMLSKGDMVIMGSDMNGPDGFKKGNNISLSLNCNSEEEINTYFKNLSSGGSINHPLQDMFWGARFGTLIDKYGIRWMLNYDKKGEW